MPLQGDDLKKLAWRSVGLIPVVEQADNSTVRVGRNSNVQDGTVIHVDEDSSCASLASGAGAGAPHGHAQRARAHGAATRREPWSCRDACLPERSV